MLAYRRMLGLSLLTVVLLGLAVSTEGTGPNTTSFQNIPSTSGQFPGKMYNSKLGENFEDDEDNSEGGSADWGTNTRNRMKEGPQDGSSTEGPQDGSSTGEKTEQPKWEYNHNLSTSCHGCNQQGTDITIIVCSLVGLVVLLIAVAVLVKHLTKPSERGDYALSPRTAE
ncbi:uncharacterized protein [Ambystoma mexicanum]|uniref:uncharacterized protein isoform X5 n=1 Tax=Ambystoma mexicanum TaxID=8296 RepID=UPI0037E94578